jgi:hypothetical protein
VFESEKRKRWKLNVEAKECENGSWRCKWEEAKILKSSEQHEEGGEEGGAKIVCKSQNGAKSRREGRGTGSERVNKVCAIGRDVGKVRERERERERKRGLEHTKNNRGPELLSNLNNERKIEKIKTNRIVEEQTTGNEWKAVLCEIGGNGGRRGEDQSGNGIRKRQKKRSTSTSQVKVQADLSELNTEQEAQNWIWRKNKELSVQRAKWSEEQDRNTNCSE